MTIRPCPSRPYLLVHDIPMGFENFLEVRRIHVFEQIPFDRLLAGDAKRFLGRQIDLQNPQLMIHCQDIVGGVTLRVTLLRDWDRSLI